MKQQITRVVTGRAACPYAAVVAAAFGGANENVHAGRDSREAG